MTSHRRSSAEILCFSLVPSPRTTVATHYRRWRDENKFPERCDNEHCKFHTQPLIWNDEQLKMIVDHKNGNKNDNRPINLRLLCPNCDSQQLTRGGSNIGRIQNQSDSGYEVAHRDGRRDANVFLKGVAATGAAGEITARGGTKDA
jgi:hypothetical protein